jgi:hypothetical protein
MFWFGVFLSHRRGCANVGSVLRFAHLPSLSDRRKTVFAEHCEAVEGLPPVLDGVPFPGQFSQRQVHHFKGRVLRRERAEDLDGFAQVHVQAFDGVGGVDDFADLGRELEEGHDALPVTPPQRARRW